MLVWSSSTSPVSEGGGHHVLGGPDFSASEQSKEIKLFVSDNPQNGETKAIPQTGDFCGRGREHAEEEREKDGPTELSKLSTNPTVQLQPRVVQGQFPSAVSNMPPASVMTRLILIMVWRKLIRNPNTYSSLIGLIWSLVSFRWDVHMPKIVQGSISILSDAGLGMAMFSLDNSMREQGGCFLHGSEVLRWPSSNGCSFLRYWPSWYSTPCRDRTGRTSTRDCSICVC
ncbi:auxin efflux carrier component 7-like isoform X1 [Olea europaea subsp. europaea]|uniref:Auxin efflux carrier component 7-like isoform X1 n=1 Tax=Olea europaea subsp. europaea TaxID=158383 RepID=A0A8S0U9W6_OLEEU|nr:auxin efflux carrier component 7-like isoform X1 [Olea europaea subsp. europaea]